MSRLLLAMIATLGLASAAAAQGALPAVPDSPPVTLPAAAAAPVPSTDYRVGPGDVLEVTVFGNDDLSRLPTVQTDGRIALPLAGEVNVLDLTIDEVKEKLTALLKQYLVDPRLDVRVKEYQSQFVTVLGEVGSPGRKPLRGHTRLVDVLVDAGGFTTRASGEVIITRPNGTFDDGGRVLRVRIGEYNPDSEASMDLALRNGDILTASPKYYVTVEGEVVRPGRYLLEGELTVTGAISSAGGVTRFGSSSVKLRRVGADGGAPQLEDVDLKAVRKGKKTDPLLKAGDVLFVPRRVF